jgi:hypothetical protein
MQGYPFSWARAPVVQPSPTSSAARSMASSISSYMGDVERYCITHQDAEELNIVSTSVYAEDIQSLIKLLGSSIALAAMKDGFLIDMAEDAFLEQRHLIVTSTAELKSFRLAKCSICAGGLEAAMIFSYAKPGQLFTKYDARKGCTTSTIRGPGAIIFCGIVCLTRYYVCFPSDPEDLARLVAGRQALVHPGVRSSAYRLHGMAGPTYRDGAAALMRRVYNTPGVVSFTDQWQSLLPGVSLCEAGLNAAKLLINPNHVLSQAAKDKMHEFVVTGTFVDVDGLPKEHIKVLCTDDTSVLKR